MSLLNLSVGANSLYCCVEALQKKLPLGPDGFMSTNSGDGHLYNSQFVCMSLSTCSL